jgi:gas vesicle protein
MGEDNQQTQGAFWGALIGALVGAFIGDENKEQARNAAIGAAIGAGAGLLIDKTRQNSNQAQAAEPESDRAERVIKEMRATNQQLRQELTAYQQQIDRLELAKSQGKANSRDLQKQKQILQQRQASAEQALSQLTNELKNLTTTLSRLSAGEELKRVSAMASQNC